MNHKKLFSSLILIILAALSIGAVSAQPTSLNVTIYDNSITPESVPIQFDSDWLPIFNFVYTDTVHGALTEAGEQLTANTYPFLKYSNVDPSSPSNASPLITDTSSVYFNNEVGWTIEIMKSGTDTFTSCALNDTISAGDQIRLSKNETSGFLINIVNTTANPNIISFGPTSFYGPSMLNLIDNQSRITKGSNNSTTTFNITLNGTYDSSISHTFEDVPINSGLGALISGSKTIDLSNNSIENLYTYNISTWYYDYQDENNTTIREWYVWLDDIDGITSDWSMTGRGWFLAKCSSVYTGNNTVLQATDSLERFTLNSTESLHICMCPSSLAGKNLPTVFANDPNYSKIPDAYNTFYYPDSSSAHYIIYVI